VEVKVVDPFGGDTSHQHFLRDVREGLWRRRPPADPEEQGVDEYLFYLASNEVLADLSRFPNEVWARHETGDAHTDLVRLLVWEILGGDAMNTWRRRWADITRVV